MNICFRRVAYNLHITGSGRPYNMTDGNSQGNQRADALEQAALDLREQTDREYHQFVCINDRSIQLIQLNGILPAVFIIIVDQSLAELLTGAPFFTIGSGFLAASVLISLIVYYFNRRPEAEIHEEEFREKVLQKKISEEEYLEWISEKRLNNLEHYHYNNKQLNLPLFAALLSFLLGAGTYVTQVLIM